MPRTLPWLVGAQKIESGSATASSSPAPKVRKRTATPHSDLVDEDLNPIAPTPQRRARLRPDRSPSTSPPPAPPNVEYMREGFTADDIWRMVDDEFEGTAKLFTQHIHHAEYTRLKKLAKARGQKTLQSITRPVDGRTKQSDRTKLRIEAGDKAEAIRDGLKKITAKDDSEDDDEWKWDPQLAGLMGKEKRGGTDLTGLAKVKSNTRATAGFTHSPEKKRTYETQRDVRQDRSSSPLAARHVEAQTDGDSDSSDDLDRPRRKKSNVKVEASRTTATKQASTRRNGSKSAGLFKPFIKQENDTESSANKTRHPSGGLKRDQPTTKSSKIKEEPLQSPTFDTGFRTRSAGVVGASEYFAKKRAQKEKREREENEKNEASYVDDIPTFLV